MKKSKRKGLWLFGLLLTLVVLLCMTACSNTEVSKNPYEIKVQEATPDFYVNDFANLFTEEQKADLIARAVNMNEEYSGIQVVITTVKSLNDVVTEWTGEKPEKFEIEQVAYAMFSQYGIGQDDMGILILFSDGDREVRIETGYRMQNYITDSAAGQLLDNYGMEYFAIDQFSQGLISVQKATIAEIQKRVPKDWKVTVSTETQTSTTVNQNTSEDEAVNAGTIQSTDKNKSSGTGILFGLFGSIGVAIAAIVAFICKIFTAKKREKAQEEKHTEELRTQKQDLAKQLIEYKEESEKQIKDLKSQFVSDQRDAEIKFARDKRTLELELKRSKENAAALENQLAIITDKYNRIQRLHPDLDFEAEIHDMIEREYKAEASSIDAAISKVLKKSADKDHVRIFSKALELFDSANPEVKKYLTSKREALQERYASSVSLKQEFERLEKEKQDKAAAEKAYQEIQSIYGANSVGNYKTFDNLLKAISIFKGLSAAQKAFFPDKSIIRALERTFSIAEEDYDNYTAAKKAEEHVHYIINSMYSVYEDDLPELERAMGYYTYLTSAQKAYFSEELLRKLKNMIDDAKEDQRRKEEKRRQERMSSSSISSSTFGSSGTRFGGSSGFSSHRGHGGRPSGGGASRRF